MEKEEAKNAVRVMVENKNIEKGLIQWLFYRYVSTDGISYGVDCLEVILLPTLVFSRKCYKN